MVKNRSHSEGSCHSRHLSTKNNKSRKSHSHPVIIRKVTHSLFSCSFTNFSTAFLRSSVA